MGVPERNHSYPASLKAAIDWHFTQWTAKPVAFVGHGGAAGGRHAMLHLENVPTELHAVTIRDGLAFPDYFTAWQDGHPLGPGIAGYAKTVLDQLAWWARAPGQRAKPPHDGHIGPDHDPATETDLLLALTGLTPLIELGVIEPEEALTAVDQHLDRLFTRRT